VEDSGTVTSPLVPWNTCGASMFGVLGVSTAAYFPYCFFNLLSPILDVVYGFVGFKVPSREPEASPAQLTTDTVVPDRAPTRVAN
jgi:NhaC family Na+:H+ antiporter